MRVTPPPVQRKSQPSGSCSPKHGLNRIHSEQSGHQQPSRGQPPLLPAAPHRVPVYDNPPQARPPLTRFPSTQRCPRALHGPAQSLLAAPLVKARRSMAVPPRIESLLNPPGLAWDFAQSGSAIIRGAPVVSPTRSRGTSDERRRGGGGRCRALPLRRTPGEGGPRVC